MFVYIWKKPDGTPFYVGMGQNLRRPSPKNMQHRNKACKQAVQEIGVDNVIVELHTVPDAESAKLLEQSFIAKLGRLTDGTGTLTNISKGGEFHAATEVTRTKLRENWQDPEIAARMSEPRIGLKRNLAESSRNALRIRMKQNPAMKGWQARNINPDPEFTAKRVAGIRAAQPQRAAKMTDPVALAQRKARVTATLNSPEYKAKRALFDTPEYRQKLSDARKEYWAKKKASISS
jgi:hypothetical protein